MKKYALLFFILALAGCMPVYLTELDSSASLTRQMTAVGTLSPVNIQSDAASVRFFPLKPAATTTSLSAVNVQSGFTVTQQGLYDYLGFAYVNSSGQAQLSSGPAFYLYGPSLYPQYEFRVALTSTTGNIVVMDYDTLNSYLYLVPLPYGGIPTPESGSTPLNPISSPFIVVGDQLFPSPGSETFYLLLWSGTGFTEGKAGVGAPPAALSWVGTTTAPMLPTWMASRALYGTNPSTGFSYASSFNGSQWVCYQWTSLTSASPVQLPGMTHRLDAVLSTGDLLSTEGGILRLYDPNGNLLVSVSLGGLQFCYEVYIGPTAYVFFSLPINLSRGDWAFRTYAIPTSSMRSLGG